MSYNPKALGWNEPTSLVRLRTAPLALLPYKSLPSKLAWSLVIVSPVEKGVEEALAAVELLRQHPRLRNYYLLPAVRGHLLMETERFGEAAECFRAALECACSEPEKRFLRAKLLHCLPPAE